MNKEKLFISLNNYLGNIDSFISDNNLKISNIKIDHICYKCGSGEEFELLRRELENSEKFIYQAIISGRRIAYVRFFAPLKCIFGEVEYLELSDQKPDNSQVSQVDHVEPYPIEIPFIEMVERFKSVAKSVEESNKPHHKTVDMVLKNGVKLRCTTERLVDKICREEMK